MIDYAVKVSNASRNYGAVKALDNVSIEVNKGEIFGIIGPNGSGKSTLVESIEGLKQLDNGDIKVFNLDPYKQRKEVYKLLGVQLQDTEYPDNIKVGELCEMFSAFYDSPADYHRLLCELNLDKKINRTVKKLSGGEKQRLSILLALLPKPKLLILDELTTGLDPEVRHQMWNALKAINNNGTGVIIVSHYLDEIEELCDRFLYLHNGVKKFVGTVEKFTDYAKGVIPSEKWVDGLSLEKLYLTISGSKDKMNLEGIL